MKKLFILFAAISLCFIFGCAPKESETTNPGAIQLQVAAGKDGYADTTIWHNNLNKAKLDYQNLGQNIINAFPQDISQEDKDKLILCDNNVRECNSIFEVASNTSTCESIGVAALNNRRNRLAAEEQARIKEEQRLAAEITQSQYYIEDYDDEIYYVENKNENESNDFYYDGNPNNFKRDGVVYQDGTEYTWYSSNVLYHQDTGQWTAGDDGFYRDSDGYLVVASDDDSYGDTVDTPWGEGKVYDNGCGSGKIDMYVNY